MRLQDAGPAALIGGLAAVVLIGTWPLTAWDGFTPGPGFFPRIVGFAGLALAAAELFERMRAGAAADGFGMEDGALRRVGLTVFGMGALAALTPMLGMTPALGLFMLFMLTAALRRPLFASLATAAGVAVAVELVFVRWLGVALPAPFFY